MVIRWLMLGLTLLFAESACERDRNAIVEGTGKGQGTSDGVGAKIKAIATSTGHEDAYRLTCYTCVNVSDNKMCNEWAIDTPCPAGGRDFCRSLHIVDSRGQSVLVNKSCASRAECSPASVGCMPIDTQKICISCCDTSYCNVESPSNSSDAVYSRKRPASARPQDLEPQEPTQSASSPLNGLSPLLLLLLLPRVFPTARAYQL